MLYFIIYWINQLLDYYVIVALSKPLLLKAIKNKNIDN